MTYLLLCAAVFIITYTVNLLYVSVFYHRAFTHSAITLTPWLQKLVVFSGNWVTGIDPKAWACMHRMHHEFSDTEKDPHSPKGRGIWRVAPAQLNSYNKTLTGLIVRKSYYTSRVKDLDFEVNWIIRQKLWYAPYLLQLVISLAMGLSIGWLFAGCYFVGIMSHPVQGWLVNALGHQHGYRNFETPDQSKNNTAVAWFVFGEGYQNNHHQNPRSPKFSYKWFEVDLGYGLCVVLSVLGLATLNENHAWGTPQLVPSNV